MTNINLVLNTLKTIKMSMDMKLKRADFNVLTEDEFRNEYRIIKRGIEKSISLLNMVKIDEFDKSDSNKKKAKKKEQITLSDIDQKLDTLLFSLNNMKRER